MSGRLTIAVSALVVLVSTGLFVGAGHLAASTLIAVQQQHQLSDLASLVLRRAETSVDYGVAALDELQAKDLVGCDPSTLQSVRLQIYQRGSLKDIRVARPNGTISCSAFSETLEFDRRWPARDDMLPAADDTVRLFRVDQFSGTALGVLEDIDDDQSLVAIMAMNTALLDVMPAELREYSNIAVELSPENYVAQLNPSIGQGMINPVTTVSASSANYPLRAVISVDTHALAMWNRDAYWPVVGLAAALGLAIGLLLSKLMIRPENPIAALDKAIAAGEFRPFMQPIFNLENNRIIGAEMLARWVKPNGEVIPPVRFIQLAEDSGRIEQMTWQLLNRALDELRALFSADKEFCLSINVTPHHFMKPGFVDELRQVVSAGRVANRQISVEITEREPFDDLEAAAGVVASLRGYGFKVALDDVGIGHSGLSHLQKLGASTIKIDKFFIDAIERDATAHSIIEMMVRLAGDLDMNLVAEGIENAAQIACLRDCGVSRGQGYIVSPPVPSDAFLRMLAENRTRPDRSGPVRQSAA